MNRMRISRAMGLVGVAATTVTLIALTWLGTISATRSERAGTVAGIDADMASQAALLVEQVQVDLLEVDQTLRVLAHAWEAEPDHFRLLSWRSDLVLLNEISPDVFVTDERGSIRDSTLLELVGSEVRDLDYFRALAERRLDDGRMFISPARSAGWFGSGTSTWRARCTTAMARSPA